MGSSTGLFPGTIDPIWAFGGHLFGTQCTNTIVVFIAGKVFVAFVQMQKGMFDSNTNLHKL